MNSKRNKLFSWASITVHSLVLILCSCKGKNDTSLAINKKINSEGKMKIDVKHQVLDLKFDWSQKQVKGITKITLSNLTVSDTLYLDAVKLSINEVQLTDGTKLDFDHDSLNKEDKLKIILDRTYKPTEEITVEVDYHSNWVNQSDPNNIWGSFGKGIRYFEPSMTENERRKQIWAVSEPESARYWFPTNDRISDLRTTELIVTVKDPLTVISSGILDSTEKTDVSRTKYHWKNTVPHAPHITTLIVGEYANYKQSFKDITINNYGYKDELEGTMESVISLPDMVKFYSEYTGLEYPFKEYSQIFVQDFGGWKGGLGTSIITENMIDDKTTHEDFLYGWDLTEGEALAHQWFGSYIKPASWNDIWLSKAFCRYFSGLYNQYKNGNTEFLIYQLSPDLNAYLNDWNSGLPTIIVSNDIQDSETFVNSNGPYAKGARVLHMLRNEVGEEKWKKLIEHYIEDYGNTLVTTNDFVNLVNRINGKPLNWFFNQWVYGPGHPIFQIEKNYNSDAKELVLAIKQTQKVDSLIGDKKTSYFGGKMVIEIDASFKEVTLEAKNENTFIFPLKSVPKVVNVDFEDTWIKEEHFEKNTTELLGELKESNDVLHRVAAMRQLSTVAIDTNTTASTKSKIKKALQQAALNEDYWRMRLIAIGQLSQIYSSDMKEGRIELDKETEQLLLTLIKKEKSWVKAWGINFLGMTRDKKYVPIYLDGLKDYSDRVTFMSAIALGKSKDEKAFNALKELPNKPSWKNQSLISALYGLKELKDQRGYDLALRSLTDSKNPHWNLATPVWDHRLAAAHALVALNKVDEAYDAIHTQFNDAMSNGNINDIFYNALQISILGDSRGKKVFATLKEKFKNDAETLKAVNQLETNFTRAIK